jgi:hypothetical protein
MLQQEQERYKCIYFGIKYLCIFTFGYIGL